MKTRRLAGILLTLVAAASPQRAAAQPLNLNNFPSMTYTQTFDTLGFSADDTNSDGSLGNLPSEWSTYTNAHATYPGSVVTWSGGAGQMLNWLNWTNGATGLPTQSGGLLWSSAFGTGSPGGGFFNFASYSDYNGGTNFFTNSTPPGGTTVLFSQGYGLSSNVLTAFPGITNFLYQTNQPNRCLGIRQTGSFGDPFAAFVLKIADTAGFHNFSLGLDFLNLDGTSPRPTIWTVDWGIADPVYFVPTSFYPIAYYTNTAGSFRWFHTNIVFPDGTINNVSAPAGAPPNLPAVWIRIATLAPSTGTGNRETFAIDNVSLSWTNGTGGCVAVDGSSGAGIEPGGIIVQPTASTVYSNASATFTVVAAGTSPIYYQWYKDGVGLSDGATGNGISSILGSRSYQILINNVGPGDQGNYSCVISNSCGSTVYVTNSASASFTITNPPAVSIAYLRSLVNINTNNIFPNYSVNAGAGAMWQVTGIITTRTNITTGNTASYYLQDGTGGINFFVTGGSSIRPNLGDEVTEIGFLSSFGGSLELEADLTGAIPANNATLVNILSNNIANYPAPKLLNWATEFAIGVTNANVEYNKKGSVCLLTNVYFGTNAGRVIGTGSSPANTLIFVTNSAGLRGWVEFYCALNNDLANRTLPRFAYAVQGPLIASSPNLNIIDVSKWSDVMTNPVILSVTHSGNNSTLTWTAVPLTYSYSVLGSTSAAGPYIPIATGLLFTNTSGAYTDTGASGPFKFYRVSSP